MSEYYNNLDLIRLAIRDAQLEMNTILPAKVESYNATTQKATVVVSICRGYKDTAFEPAKLFDVKVAFPRVGNRGMSYPLKKGDHVLLAFSQRDYTKWARAGVGFGPETNDLFPINGAIILAGFAPDADIFLQSPSATELVGDKVFIGKPDEVGPALTPQVFPTVPPALNPAGNPVLAVPALSPTGNKQYGPLNLDLVSLLIAAIENIIAAGYGTDTTAAGIISIGQMDPLSSANLTSIVNALKKLKVGV